MYGHPNCILYIVYWPLGFKDLRPSQTYQLRPWALNVGPF